MKRAIEIESFKGILILLVILGHNSFFSASYNGYFRFLYNFHVACFLLLPFLFASQRVALNRWDRVCRYLVPHLVFFIVACAAYFVIFVKKQPSDVLTWVWDVTRALIFSTEGTYQEAIGLRMFWFLPALLLMVSLRDIVIGMRISWAGLALVLAILVHSMIGFIPKPYYMWIPWSVPLVLFLFPVGLAVAKSAPFMLGQHRWLIFISSAGLFILCTVISFTWPSHVGLAGDPRIFAINQPVHLIFHDVLLLTAFVFFLTVNWYLPAPLVQLFGYIGSNSLFLFLSHAFVWQTLAITGVLELLENKLNSISLILASFILVTMLSLLLNVLMRKSDTLYSIVFPATIQQFKSALHQMTRKIGFKN